MTDDEPLREQSEKLIADFRAALAFLTRIPASALGGTTNQPLGFRQAAQMFPLVGAVVGATGGLVVVLAIVLGLPTLVAAGLAVAATIVLTGALHEDGLADAADGFGGGATAARKLEIMDDSRIGTFGAVAVALSVVLRVAALTALIAAGGVAAGAALIAAEAASRGAMVKLWHDLPAARPGGMADRAGPPDHKATFVAIALAAVIVAIAIVPTFGIWAAFAGTAALIAVGYGCALLFVDQIGGQTGDALGACQQSTAIAFLVAISAFG
jgi:adenosylcobinamide-GDP ribazoletransferase